MLWAALFSFSVIVAEAAPNDYTSWVNPEVCQKNIIYKCRNYGAEAVYNPITLSLNAGTEENYFQNPSRKLTNFPYNEGFDIVASNMAHPFKSIGRYGWGAFLRSEIFPLEWHTRRMQWVPNYTLHLLGGSSASRALEEWYAAHNAPAPKVWMLLNFQGYQLLNEIFEGRYLTGTNVDPIADLYFFNTIGILLGQWDAWARLVTEDLHLADWSPMPTFNLLDGSLQNNTQRFSLKFFSPFSNRLSLMVLLGLEGMGGLSYRFNETDSFSAAGGVQPKYFTAYPGKNSKSAELTWMSGVFWDRNNTPLLSVTYSHRFEAGLSLNMYPGILKIGGLDFGLWFSRKPGNRFFAGITTVFGPGIGAGPKSY